MEPADFGILDTTNPEKTVLHCYNLIIHPATLLVNSYLVHISGKSQKLTGTGMGRGGLMARHQSACFCVIYKLYLKFGPLLPISRELVETMPTLAGLLSVNWASRKMVNLVHEPKLRFLPLVELLKCVKWVRK